MLQLTSVLLFLASASRSKCKPPQANTSVNNLQTTQFSAVQSWLTWVVWQVREANRLALHLVREATQGDADFDLFRDVLVLVGWSLEHDGDLPVHVCLGKFPARLPRPSPENDLYVICGSVTSTKTC